MPAVYHRVPRSKRIETFRKGLNERKNESFFKKKIEKTILSSVKEERAACVAPPPTGLVLSKILIFEGGRGGRELKKKRDFDFHSRSLKFHSRSLK